MGKCQGQKEIEEFLRKNPSRKLKDYSEAIKSHWVPPRPTAPIASLGWKITRVFLTRDEWMRRTGTYLDSYPGSHGNKIAWEVRLNGDLIGTTGTLTAAHELINEKEST